MHNEATSWAPRSGTCAAPLASAWAQLSRSCVAQWGNDLGTTIKYRRHTVSGAVSNGLGTTFKYLRRAASGASHNGLSRHRGLLMCPFTEFFPLSLFKKGCLRRQQAEKNIIPSFGIHARAPPAFPFPVLNYDTQFLPFMFPFLPFFPPASFPPPGCFFARGCALVGEPVR
jgi:hypothetical protein